MGSERIVDITGCTEFRHTLEARGPGIVHGAAILLITLLATSLLWAALTRADLVVRAPGRVRPVSTPTKVFYGGQREGRVVEVNFRQGQEVSQGQILLRLDTERLDNEITKRKQAIYTGTEELAKFSRIQELMARQFEVTKARAEAELFQACEEVRRAKEQQRVDVCLAEVEVETTQDEEARLQKLDTAVSPAELVKARARLREAQERLAAAGLPVEEGRVEVLRQGLLLAERDYEVKQEELALKRTLKQGEVATDQAELANLELERKEAVIHSPRDGTVISEDIHVGDLVQAGKAVVEIAENSGFRFDVVVPNEEMAHLAVGMQARVKLDAYDYQRYGVLNGTVSFISPDSGVPQGPQAAFYILRIELEGDEVGCGDFRGKVKLGMAGQAEVVTTQEAILSLLFRRFRQTISLG
jgi:HlyD family secretion protein